jgi:PII-like signaling protein
MEDKTIMSVVSNLPIVVEVSDISSKMVICGMILKRNKIGW